MTRNFPSPSSGPAAETKGPEFTPKAKRAQPCVRGETNRWRSRAMEPDHCDLVGVKWSSSRSLRHDQEDEILILLEDDESLAGTARKNWMQMDKDLKKGMRKAVRERDGCQSWAQTPKSPLKSGVNRWGESPRKTTIKNTIQAPMSWHAGGKQKWKASPEWGHATIPVVPLSPLHSSTPVSQRQQRQGNGTNDSMTKWSFHDQMSDVSTEFNRSMSSLAPQLPKRFSSNGSVTSVDAQNVVVRGHRLYKIETTSRNCQFDHLLPSQSDSDRDLKLRVDQSKTELLSSPHHPPTIPEDRESVSLDCSIEEAAGAASPTNDGLNAQDFSEELFTGLSQEDANERPNDLSDLEKHSPRDVELFEHEVLRDMNNIFAAEEGADGTETKDLNLQPVDTSEVKVMVVDKVPTRKRWSSKNIENFPIWPPVVRVIKFENRNAPGASDGSTSFDDLTASEGDFLSSLGDDDLSAGAEMALLLPEQQTSYRIRYHGPTSLGNLNEIYGLPPLPVRDDRFEPLSGPSDLMPHVPARTSCSDTIPKAPRRGTSMEDHDDASLRSERIIEMQSRPDVWITPLDGDSAKNAVWKVKRVWAVDQEDEKEEVHSVHNIDLFRKIKTLVGAPNSPSYASSPVGGDKGKVAEDEMSCRESRSWHVLSVVERNGKVDRFEPEREFAEDKFRENLHHMAEEAVKEVDMNKKAIEEAKRRIMMLKNSDPSKTPRRAPKMLRRNLNEAVSASDGSPLRKDHTLLKASSRTEESNQGSGNDTSACSDEAQTVDKSHFKSTQDCVDPPSSPSAENGSSVHDPAAENNAISDTDTSRKKEKSPKSPKKSSLTWSPKKTSPRNPVLSPHMKDGSFDIPPPMSSLKATWDCAYPPSSPSVENGSSVHDPGAENNTISDTDTSKKKKKRQKSPKKSSSAWSPKKSPRNHMLSSHMKDGSFDIPPPMSYFKATQDFADPPSSPSAENGSSGHDAVAENSTISDTDMSKKKKKRQKSSPKKSSSGWSPKKTSSRNLVPSPQTKDGSFDIPPPPPQLPLPTTPTTIKKKRKNKKAKENEKAETKGSRSLRSPGKRRIYDMVVLSDSDAEPAEESTTQEGDIEHKTSLEYSFPKSPSPGKSISAYSTPKPKKIQAAAMVHDSDSEDDSVSETTKQKPKSNCNFEALKESRKNGLSWWQVRDQNTSSGKPSIEPCTVSPKRRGGKRTTAIA